MTARTAWFCLLLFAAGAAGGWLWPARNPPADSSQNPTTAGTQRPTSITSATPGVPEPSGLPGDMIHLSAITDLRTLRAVWAAGDDATRAALFVRWVQGDPAEGIRFYLFELVNQTPRSPHHAQMIARAWAKRAPLEYLAFLNSVPGGFPDNLQSSFDSVIQNGLISDPAGILKVWETAGPALRESMYQYIFPYLFATDPARALAEAEHAPQSWQWKIWGAASEAADPAALLGTLLEKEGAARFTYAIGDLIAKQAETDLPAALENAIKLPPGRARQWACQQLVEKLAETDPEAAWAWMEAHAPTDANRREAGEALMEKNPLKAIALDPQGSWWYNTHSLKEYATKLAAKDWEAAAALAQSVGPALRRSIVQGMVFSLSFQEGDPLPQLDRFSRLVTDSGIGSKISANLLFRELDPAHAPVILAWLTHQPEAVRDILTTSMVSYLSEGSISQAADWFAQMPSAGNVIVRPGESGPAIAAAWLAQLPPGKVRTEQLLQITSEWAGTDPQAAADFALTLPPGTDRDYAVLNTAIAWHRNAPAAALAWLEALPDSPAKTRALTELNPPGAKP